jgi:endoglucanase
MNGKLFQIVICPMRFFLGTSIILLILLSFSNKQKEETSWIRINLLGYKPEGIKVAVWCTKGDQEIKSFQVVDAKTKKIAFNATAGKAFGQYGPFSQTYRLNFSGFKKPGTYYLQAGGAKSPEFTIGQSVYKGTADFTLRYMRQQRCGYNPFLKDSCHTHDGYAMYGAGAGLKDSNYIDATGGWHDASDYLQYVTTSANATYHLLMSYRDFPQVFTDEKHANGLEGKNGRADVLDEAKWGLEWLVKMHPNKDWMFNQIADDRDHMGFRIPKEDSFYGKGWERPVYMVTGEPQGLFKYRNRTKGTSSTAAKMASAFALGRSLFERPDPEFSSVLKLKYQDASRYANKKPGVTQTAPGRAPYFYEEDNWVDDMELSYAASGKKNMLDSAYDFARMEPVTPWLGNDTAKHYQWYPFINLGHYELARQLKDKRKDTIIGFYKDGIERVWNKAKQNGFFRGVPFIWCSNNLTTSFAIQCYWYKDLTGDKQFEELEQANFDWLFGCNPWGTSMVYGLPSWGDSPVDPHSAFTHLRQYPIDGGLVDGPVYGSIYRNLLGIRLHEPDEYAVFQSDLVVYHDDFGDYSTNEPTMDGTASLVYLLAAREAENSKPSKKKIVSDPFTYSFGAITRGDTTKKKLSIVFTGDEFGDGGNYISKVLSEKKVRASFFLTGRFYRNPQFRDIINRLKKDGHYLAAHSNEHLLYADWKKRDSLLVTESEFKTDLLNNYAEMETFGIKRKDVTYFLPPFEWYNDTIAAWTVKMGMQLINFTQGTISHADYTRPDEKNYRSSEEIYNSIRNYERSKGLNGFILLMHIGTHADRTDKFYQYLPQLLDWLKTNHYQLVGIDELL